LNMDGSISVKQLAQDKFNLTLTDEQASKILQDARYELAKYVLAELTKAQANASV